MQEQDPLLPRNEPAPEIFGAGYGSTGKRREEILTPLVDEDESARQHKLHADNFSHQEGVRSASLQMGSFAIFSLFLFACLWYMREVGGKISPDPGHLHPIPGQPKPISGRPHGSYEERAKVILTETPLIDGHTDLAIFIREKYKNTITSDEFRDKFENGGMDLNVDLPRLRKGMTGGAFWSAFVVCPENASEDFSDEQYATEVSHTIQQIDLIKRLQRQYPGNFTAAGSSIDNMLENFHSTRSLFGPISIEGLHQVSQTSAMSTLRLFYELGVRAATLTWNCHNAFADAALITNMKNGSTVIAPYHRGGLTPAGRKLVKEMNRLGMLVDISHTSYWTQKAVLSNDTSRSPVIYTHSSAFELCPHPRNVKNDILDLVKETNSLVMINFNPDFISCQGDGVGMPELYQPNNTVHQVARHIAYVGDRIGYEHVGLGSDFDGIGNLAPKGLEGVDKYPDLVVELLKMGVSDQDAAKVVGGNLLRVWRRAEQVATQMQAEGIAEGEDDVTGY